MLCRASCLVGWYTLPPYCLLSMINCIYKKLILIYLNTCGGGNGIFSGPPPSNTETVKGGFDGLGVGWAASFTGENSDGVHVLVRNVVGAKVRVGAYVGVILWCVPAGPVLRWALLRQVGGLWWREECMNDMDDVWIPGCFTRYFNCFGHHLRVFSFGI